MISLVARIGGIGLLGPGLGDWAAAAAVLRGSREHEPRRTELPAPQLLPAAERRRATAAVKLTLASGLQALAMAQRSPDALRTVFATTGGDGLNCHALCETLASSERLVSPTRFHNSVHNAASGYWGIATHSMAPSTVICAANDGSFAAGLLEALAQVATSGDEVLLLSYDTDYPEPLRSVRPIPDGFAVALLLAPDGAHAQDAGLARIELDPAAPLTDAPADSLPQPRLEAMRRAFPAARALPLLRRIALRESGSVALDYLSDRRLLLRLQAC